MHLLFPTDLIVQAKSGTGKTCLFTVISLESIDLSVERPQVLVLASTREIAVQIHGVFQRLGRFVERLRCSVCIGGLSTTMDVTNVAHSQVVIGTPGRVLALLQQRSLSVEHLRLLVLDEVDKLFDESLRPAVQSIVQLLPRQRQTMVFSASYGEAVMRQVRSMMRANVQTIMLDRARPSLLGVRQFYCRIADSADNDQRSIYQRKLRALTDLLDRISFHQCLVFLNSRNRAEWLARTLDSQGWPARCLSGMQPQQQRLETFEALKQFQMRILVSTDLVWGAELLCRARFLFLIVLPFSSFFLKKRPLVALMLNTSIWL
jgi:ATP-dependent RNA helicase DDX20